MSNPQTMLLKLNQNLNILQEREAKYAGNAPLELLNQISDHRRAIDLTRQVITGELDEQEWQESLKPLLLACQDGQVINIDAQTYIADSITIHQFIGSQIPLAEQLEFFKKQLGLESTQASEYARSQFEAYCGVWKSLQALRLAGNDLWEQANGENVLKFANQLRETQAVVWEGEIFFEEEDRQGLLEILEAFGRFRLGKMRLIEIHSKRDITNFVPEEYLEEEVRVQIGKNFVYKTRYEELLEKIRVSFRQRLSK